MIGNFIKEIINFQYFSHATKEETEIDFINLLPQEIILEIFSYLNAEDLARCQSVNKQWKVLANHEALWNALIPKIAFGKKQWAKYFGDIGKEPPLPKFIHKILKSPCPFWTGKKVEETHMLVLIPETVNGNPLNLTTLEMLVRAPKEGKATQYRYTLDDIINKHFNQSTTKSHWVLMTKNVIPGSKGIVNLEDQQKYIATFTKQEKTNYEVPNLLDAVTCIFMKYVSSGKRLFNHNENDYIPLTYTYCQEKINDSQISIGGFFQNGLGIIVSNGFNNTKGVAVLKKFF